MNEIQVEATFLSTMRATNAEYNLPCIKYKKYGEVNFYLKKPNSKGLSLIYLKFKYNGQTPFVYSFGQTVDPDDWSVKKQRVDKKIFQWPGKKVILKVRKNM